MNQAQISGKNLQKISLVKHFLNDEGQSVSVANEIRLCRITAHEKKFQQV